MTCCCVHRVLCTEYSTLSSSATPTSRSGSERLDSAADEASTLLWAIRTLPGREQAVCPALTKYTFRQLQASIPAESRRAAENATAFRNDARLFRPNPAGPVQDAPPVLTLSPACRAALFPSWIIWNEASEICPVPRQSKDADRNPVPPTWSVTRTRFADIAPVSHIQHAGIPTTQYYIQVYMMYATGSAGASFGRRRPVDPSRLIHFHRSSKHAPAPRQAPSGAFTETPSLCATVAALCLGSGRGLP